MSNHGNWNSQIDLWNESIRKVGEEKVSSTREANNQFRKFQRELEKAKHGREVERRLQNLAKELFQRSYTANAGPTQLQEWGKEIELIRKMIENGPF